MLFHTGTFAIFFALFLACWLPARKRGGGPFVILAFSNLFYGWWNWKFLGLLWITILVDYSLARMLERTEAPGRRRLIVAASLVSNLGILGFFKYYNFFLDGLGAAGVGAAAGWKLADLVLPVGISFYIFQSLSYTIDVYRRQQKPVANLVEYAAFVCYFPQLVAGPIERLSHLLPQIAKPAAITPERILSGLLLFCGGYFRKGVADTIATFVDPVFANPDATLPMYMVLAIAAFGLQIYLDFTGYVDMARGVSRAIGIDLMLNFDVPYTSLSIREFWRRWHISLSQWLRDYLYISLGGSRHGLPRHLAALMITMLLGGLWHGAGLNFVIWGGLHGLYLCIHVLWERAKPGLPALPEGRAWRWAAGGLSWLLTWVAVNYAWLYFRAPTFEIALAANRKVGQWLLAPGIPPQLTIIAMLLAAIAVIAAMDLRARFRPEGAPDREPPLTAARAAGRGLLAGAYFAVGYVLLAGAPTQQFIYFQF